MTNEAPPVISSITGHKATTKAVAVTGVAVMSSLGHTPEQHRRHMDGGQTQFRPLCKLPGAPPGYFDEQLLLPDLPTAWIEPRSLFAGRRYGPATNFSLAVARHAVADAALLPEALRDAWLLVGSSRGNTAGWIEPWPGRRGHAKMATSNSMHSEMAAAVSIELGIRGPYHVLSNGCASGLDALGFGYWAVASGMAPRALVTAADLPLVRDLLHPYAQTGLLSRNGINDPYSPETTGFLPGEAGAALVLEPVETIGTRHYGFIHGYWANSDAYDPLGLPPDGAGTAECLQTALNALPAPSIAAICPHASGTLAHGQAERRALQTVFGNSDRPISLHLMKPFTGHSIGASGLVDAAILLHYMRDGLLPPNLPNLSGAGAPFHLPATPVPIHDAPVLKISVGMGGHNAIVALSRKDTLS